MLKEVINHREMGSNPSKPYRVTFCELLEDGYRKAIGISICSPSDQYNRKLGNTIARGRAYKALSLKKCISPSRIELVTNLGLCFYEKGVYIN